MHGVPQVVSSSGYVSAVSAGVQCAVSVFEAAKARASQAEAPADRAPVTSRPASDSSPARAQSGPARGEPGNRRSRTCRPMGLED
jgi:hypothetical protein